MPVWKSLRDRPRQPVRVLLVLVGLVAALVPVPALADVPEVSGERLDRFVRTQMERTGVPGAAYAVVSPEGLVHRGTFGVDGRGDPVGPGTAFLWGSVAKPVTATLTVLLAEDGVLALDEPVTTYLPRFRTADKQPSARITVRHLVEQTSGLPDRTAGLVDVFDTARRPADSLPELATVSLTHRPGSRFEYSSLNYLVLSAVVEAATGRPFSDVLEDRVLGPLGMDTAITTPAQAEDRLPAGHRYVLGRPTAFTTDYDPAGAGYGYLGGTLADAAAFARAHLSGSELLPAELRQQLHAPAVDVGEGRSYGLGWRTWPVYGADASMVWHSGAVAGYLASVVLLPQQDRAVVVLQNTYGAFQENPLLDTSWGIASLLSGAEPVLHDPGPAYLLVLLVLGAVDLLLILAATAAVRRLVRPRPVSVRRRVAALCLWLLTFTGTAVGLAAVPGVYGIGLEQVPLWAPDVGFLLYAGLVLAVLAGLLRGIVALRSGSGTTAADQQGSDRDAEPTDVARTVRT